MAPSDRPPAPQRVCGCLPFSYGDYTVRSPVSQVGGLDGVPGSPGRLPPGSGTSIFSPVPEVLRGGVGLPVLCPLLWSVDSSSGIHPRHGPGLLDHASSRVPDSPVLRRLAGPCFHLSGDCVGEGLSPLAMSSTGDPCQSSQELIGSQPESGLFGDDRSDFSFEGFPDPQTDSEVVASSSGLSVDSLPPCVSLAPDSGHHVVDVCASSGSQASYAVSPTLPQCLGSSSIGRGSGVLGRLLPPGSSVVVRRFTSPSGSAPRGGSPRPVLVHRRLGHRLGCLSRRRPSLRLVVSPPLPIFYQPPGAFVGSVCDSEVSSFSAWSCGGGVLRQHHGPGVPQETGWHSLFHSQRGGSGYSSPL